MKYQIYMTYRSQAAAVVLEARIGAVVVVVTALLVVDP